MPWICRCDQGRDRQQRVWPEIPDAAAGTQARSFWCFMTGPNRPMPQNWLLDLQLATAVFKADQAGIWLAKLGLPPQFESVVRDHMEFYRSKARVAELKRLLQPSIPNHRVRLRMLAVCAGAEGGLDTVIEALLGDLAEGRDDAMRLIERRV